MKHLYALSLADKKDLRRIYELLAHHAAIIKILNDDSRRSPRGGAAMTYEVRIELKERWS